MAAHCYTYSVQGMHHYAYSFQYYKSLSHVFNGTIIVHFTLCDKYVYGVCCYGYNKITATLKEKG